MEEKMLGRQVAVFSHGGGVNLDAILADWDIRGFETETFADYSAAYEYAGD